MEALQQKEKPCVLENQIQQEENHSVQDITVTIQDQEQKQGTGVVENGSLERNTN